jgi:hypothetical protein
MQAKKILFLGLALAAVPCLAKDLTCHEWNTFEKVGEKGTASELHFLKGFREGMLMGAAGVAVELENGTTVSTEHAVYDVIVRFSAPVSYGDLAKGVSAICERPENTLIRVSDAVPAFIMQVKGKPQIDIDAFLTSARASAIKNRL